MANEPTMTAKAIIQEKPKNLRRKLLDAMAEVGSIAKAGRNKQGEGYSYQRAADIFEAVQEAFIKHGIAFVSSEDASEWPETHTSKSGGTVFVCHVKMRFTLLDADSDEKIEACHSGEAFDSSDKALNKAKTAALKYFLKHTLLIGEDEDDSEHDSHEVQTPACPKCGVVGAIFKDKEKPEWYCWKKRGGCGERFNYDPAKGPAVAAPSAAPADVERALPLKNPPAGAPAVAKGQIDERSTPEMQDKLWKYGLRVMGEDAAKKFFKLHFKDLNVKDWPFLTKLQIAKLNQAVAAFERGAPEPGRQHQPKCAERGYHMRVEETGQCSECGDIEVPLPSDQN